MNRRRFNKSERAAMYLAADGKCEECGIQLEPGWHGDHVNPYSKNGITDVINGQALCPPCNLKKGNKVGIELLGWQREVLEKYQFVNASRFLIAAFPGMGKTFCAAAILKAEGKFGIILVPQADSTGSWRKSLHAVGICPSAVVNGDGWATICADCEKPVGAVVMTFAFAAANPHIITQLYRANPNSLLILDEVHHLADEQAWSVPFIAARPYIKSVLCLSATPFRTDEEPVPFVHTEGPWTKEISMLPDSCVADYNYGRALTMKPPPVNSAVFERYDADVTWMEDDADEVTVKISAKSKKDVARKARRHVLNPQGNWLPLVLEQSNAQLDLIREENVAAGGLIIFSSTNAAVAGADLLHRISGGPIHVYTQEYATDSHKPGNGRKQPNGKRSGHDPSYDLHKQFTDGNAKWVLTVYKISEGVDVPRLQVLVYATVTRTRLFFIQAVGRVIRVVRTLSKATDQTAWVYIPDDEYMRTYAADIEDQQALAEIAKLDEDEYGIDDDALFSREWLCGERGDPRDRFVSAEAAFSGTTAAGEFHDAELAALAREMGGQPTQTLSLLSKLRERGMLNLTSPSPPPAPTSDPLAKLQSRINSKTAAVNAWAGQRVKAGEFSAFRDSVRDCNTELGQIFDVWKSNKNITITQLEKATTYAREQTKFLRGNHG